jgi:hypothetical protein
MATSYNPKIVTSGLVLCLDAANRDSYPGSGTLWSDLSGNRKVGSLVNGPTYNSSNLGSIAFDGTDDYVSVSQSLSTPITVTSFVRLTDFSKTANALISTNPHNVLGIQLNRLGNGEIYVYVGNGSTWLAFPSIASTSNMLVNTWYQVSFTSTGSSSTLFLNQNIVGTSSNSPSGWGSTYYLGSIVVNNTECLKGNIGTTMVYNRALSSTEISQNFNALRGRYGV